MNRILVTGGAGYIGSHTVRHLIRAGFGVTVIDNLYSGFRWAVDDAAEFVEGDVGDYELVCGLLRDKKIDAVIHFAGHVVVFESVDDPLKYYRNNTVNSQRLLQACLECGVRRFLFSSTCSVYGETEGKPIAEDSPLNPINPYARSKLMTEWMLQDTARARPLEGGNGPFRYIALRYFNVAGAAVDGRLGQATPEATHLIKVASEVACGKRPAMQIFGTDYPTPDGTCIRDYIHVDDLADAHVKALGHLLDGGESSVFNCGYGRGYSVREVVDTMRRVSGRELIAEETERRPGDPPMLIANNRKIRKTLGWTPKHDDLELICRTALEWETKLEEHQRQAG
jgi:UDP-glucose 4-epimerase